MSEAERGKAEVLDLERYVPALLTFAANKLSWGATSLYQRLFGVGVTEWRIMSLLAIEPGINAARVVQVIGLDKAAVSRVLKTLEERGAVRIVPDDADGRRQRVALTPKGRRLHDRILPVALERARLLTDGLTEEERRVFIRALNHVNARIPDVNAYEPPGDGHGAEAARPKGKQASREQV